MASWITRGEAARRIGIGKTSLVRLECREIFPAIDTEGVRGKKNARYFDPLDVERLARERGRDGGKPLAPGTIAKRAFRMLQRGTTIYELVCELEITPAEARTLQREFVTPLEESVPEDPFKMRIQEEKEHARKLRELDKQIAAMSRSRRKTG